MKTDKKNTKSETEQLKQIRDKISYEIKSLNSEELKKYIDEKLKQNPIAVRKNSQKK